MFDFLVVGAGFAGSVLAERLASEKNKRVLVVDKRNHIGGNAYDYFNEQGILVHKYGPHIFHTNNHDVWTYLSQFTEWYHYQHRVLSYVDGQLLPFPINLDTVNLLYGYDFNIEELREYFRVLCQAEGLQEITNAEEMAISRVGNACYEKFFKNYTRKQWGVWPAELAAEVTARIPVRYNRDSRYFSDCYQGVPKYGYSKLFENLLDHPNISIMLNTDYKLILKSVKFDKMIYTGPIDYFFDEQYGTLPYRSLRFEFETLDMNQYQSVGTVNFPNDYDFTRITEFKHLTGQQHPQTTIMREYSAGHGEPYYPIPQAANQEVVNAYRLEAQRIQGDVFFVGRLAEYKYYNMDAVVEKALAAYRSIKNS